MQPRLGAALVAGFTLLVLVTTAPPSQANAQEPSFAPIAGMWWTHGAFLEVDEFGIADLEWRIYRWCESEVDTDCDRIVGNVIVAGGQARILFDYLAEDRAEGRVLWVRGGQNLVAGPVTFWLAPDGLEGTGRFAQADRWLGSAVLCRSSLPPEWHVEHNFPCGI